MEILWSPWRKKYIEENNKTTGCIFCNEAQKEDGPGNLIVVRGSTSYVMLNRFPYTSGHLMIVPFIHLGTFSLLDPATRAEMMELVSTATSVLGAVYHPDGFNVGANIGSAAGAGVAEHVHIHVVPRWAGDTNFMSTLGETRVLPEELEETYHRLHTAWSAL
jgi:ATP adenylyltransferase